MKKVLSFFTVLFMAVLLISCGDKKYTVTFDPNGGALVGDAKVTVKEGEKVAKPSDPTRDGYDFLFWLLDEEEYDFDAAVEGDLVLKAEWQVVNFVEDIDDELAVSTLGKLVLPGKVSKNLQLPSRVDNVAIEWQSSNEEVVSSAGVVTQKVKNEVITLTAVAGKGITRDFWVTVYGSEVDLDATYRSAYGEIVTLNPLDSEGASDSDVYEKLVSYLYGDDYDWELAMKDGFADFPGDFSKIRSDRNPEGTVEMPSIKVKKTLSMAAKFPYAVNKKKDNVIEGSYGQLLDQEAAKETLDDKWIIEIRKDLKFEDGTPINVDTFEYSYKEYLNGKVQNARANYLYNDDYIPLVNGYEYFKLEEGISWEDVGFRKLDDYRFELALTGEKTQHHVMTYLGIINLVHPESYAKGFNENGTSNNYGSVANPLVSYGPFTLVNDYEDTEIFTFLRNENYHKVWDVPFAKLEGKIIKDQTDIINEFKAGNLDVAGVGGEFWNEFQDNINLYVAPENSFYRLAISLERPDNKAKPILGYSDFRRALYLATDREDFANNVQPPSQPLLGYLSNIHQVSEWAGGAYNSSAAHLQQLEELGLSPETNGYDSVEAKRLFNKARAEAIAAGDYAEGEKIKVEFLYYDAGSNRRIASWVKEQYEEVFGTENFEIVLNPVSSDELSQQRNAGDFDLVFTGMSGATFQATFGMGYIFSPTFSSFLVGKGHNIPEKEVTAEIINLFSIVANKDPYAGPSKEEIKAAKEAAEEAGEEYIPYEVSEGERTLSEQEFFETLEETQGVFNGTFDELFNLFSATPELDVEYDGQEEDLTAITAALEKVLLEQLTAVSLFSSTSAAVYSEQVVILPHAYSLFLGWGGMSYMYKTK